jgi:hypothetical protein
MRLDCSTPEGERRTLYTAPRGQEKQEKDNYRTSEKRKWKTMETPDTRPRNLDPLSPPDQTFSNMTKFDFTGTARDKNRE